MRSTRRQALTSLALALSALPAFAAWRGGRLLPAGPQVDSFLGAVRAGDVGRVRALLSQDASLARAKDGQGRSAFVLAHMAGQAEVAALLLGCGLELDLVESVLAEDWERFEALAARHPELLNRAHPIGGTPMHAAALCGSLDFWRLRSVGCDPDAAPAGGNGFTPARTAMDAPRVEWAAISAKDLLGNGSDPNAAQRGGDTLLHGAVRRRSELLLRLAIRKGADVHAKDEAGRSARELALLLEWAHGARLLAGHAELPRDHRASRFDLDANREKIRRPDMSGVPPEVQSAVTGASHMRFAAVKEHVSKDRRLVFSISSDDELAIEASAHTGNREIMRYHLDHGAPYSLPTAVSMGDLAMIEFLLERDPLLVHERGAHDFPVMWYVVLGGGGPEVGELLMAHGVSVDQDSVGSTALHWAVRRNQLDAAAFLLESGADPEALGYQWDRAGLTPLGVAALDANTEMQKLLRDAGARV